MRILAFSDWRIHALEDVYCGLSVVRPAPDIILYGGDDVVRFGEPSFKALLAANVSVPSELPDQRILPPRTQRPARIHLAAPENYYTLAFKTHSRSRGGILETLRESMPRLLKRCMHLDLLLSPRRLVDQQRLTFYRLLNKPRSVGQACETIENNFRLILQEDCGDSYAVFYWPSRHPRPNEFSRLARRARFGLGGVIGNDCQPWHRDVFRAPRVRDLHCDPRFVGGFGIIGLEGSPGSIGFVTYSEREAAQHLWDSAARFPRGTPLIVVSHAPPHGVLDLALRFGVGRIGSTALRKFIDTHNVHLVICGHVHMGGGKTERLGRCLVVNVANHDNPNSEPKLAVIDLETNSKPIVEWVWPRHLRPSALIQCGPIRTRRLKEAGIRLRDDVLKVTCERLARIARVNPKVAAKWQLHASAIRQRHFLQLPTKPIPDPFPERVIYYDIETLPIGQGNLVWLIGVLADKSQGVIQFLAKHSANELTVLKKFMDFIDRFPEATLVCYSGTNFDHNYVLKRLRRYSRLLARRFDERSKLDLQSYLRHQAVPPSYGWGLKTVTDAARIPMRYSITGLDVALMYLESMLTKKEPNWKIMCGYNEDDVLAMPRILERFQQDCRIASTELGRA